MIKLYLMKIKKESEYYLDYGKADIFYTENEFDREYSYETYNDYISFHEFELTNVVCINSNICVRFKSIDEMAECFPMDSDGDIICRGTYVNHMNHLKDTTVTMGELVNIINDDDEFHGYCVSLDMFKIQTSQILRIN